MENSYFNIKLNETESAILNLIHRKDRTASDKISVELSDITQKNLWYGYCTVTLTQDNIERSLSTLLKNQFIQKMGEGYLVTDQGNTIAVNLKQDIEAQMVKAWANSSQCREIREILYQNVFNIFSNNHPANYPQYDMITQEQATFILQEILEAALQVSSGYILDIGCGAGGVTGNLLRNTALSHMKFIGVDKNKDLIEYANNTYPKTMSNFICMDANTYVQESLNQKISAAILIDMLFFLKKEDAFTLIQDLFQKLEPQGKIIISLGARPKGFKLNGTIQLPIDHDKSPLNLIYEHFNALDNSSIKFSCFKQYQFWHDTESAILSTCPEKSLSQVFSSKDHDLGTRSIAFEALQALEQEKSGPDDARGRWCLAITKIQNERI